ncbi:hypothetical protein M3936_01800 [Sutcliffiella horikoshii]|uniref:hypothetical protein n=1 Tax=Sutcliffiella horikoshii TaxID=79883 RepID=UPI00203D5467|nr:hypothetical protein [Sutcliffiella horikoshii]MCM3616304.1 hypothetical protein [Sutcliffiella horikoshii]
MNISKDDQAILEQALHAALSNSTDYNEIDMYEKLLKKFSAVENKNLDGFRYDYGDSSST